jgi:transcription termination factor Rho
MKYNRYNKSSNNTSNHKQNNEENINIENNNDINNHINYHENEINLHGNNQDKMNRSHFDFDPIKKLSLKELQSYVQKINNFSSNNIGNKELLICDLMKYLNEHYCIKISGVLEIIQENYGFLRYLENNCINTQYDIYVSPTIIHKFGLRYGDVITCIVISKIQQINKFFAVYEILDVSGFSPKIVRNRDLFEYLTPQYPNEQIVLETEGEMTVSNFAMRAVDLISPCGKGQRMLIVSQPKSGKTTLLQQMAVKISKIKDLTLIVLLIDERPEEVTDIKRLVPNSLVVSSTFDQEPDKHIKVTEMVFHMAKRLAENKKDVVILMDSLTRLARAYNNEMPSSGKVLSGGFDAAAIQKAKSCLGIARNLEEGGSITIIATALHITGSKGDDVVYEELKSTGNSETVLSREIAQKNIFPAFEIGPSSTRKAELFIPPEYYRKLKILWNFMLNSMTPKDSITWLLDMIKNTQSNKALFEHMNKMNNKNK